MLIIINSVNNFKSIYKFVADFLKKSKFFQLDTVHSKEYNSEKHKRSKAVKRIKITAVRKTEYPDLMEKYENPIEHACDIKEGDVFIANGWERPEGFCLSAWESISAFVMTLAHGGENFYDGWMKNPRSAMISCNDGFRPVSFYIEVLDEEAE